MQDSNEHYIENEMPFGHEPELEVVEVEPDKETPDKMVPIVDIEAIIRQECTKWITPPIAEA